MFYEEGNAFNLHARRQIILDDFLQLLFLNVTLLGQKITYKKEICVSAEDCICGSVEEALKLKSQRITKVITVHPKGDMNVCTTFHGGPSNRC